MKVEKNMGLIKPKEKTNKSLRISLTEKCNYKCFFCHEEGLIWRILESQIKQKKSI